MVKVILIGFAVGSLVLGGFYFYDTFRLTPLSEEKAESHKDVDTTSTPNYSPVQSKGNISATVEPSPTVTAKARTDSVGLPKQAPTPVVTQAQTQSNNTPLPYAPQAQLSATPSPSQPQQQTRLNPPDPLAVNLCASNYNDPRKLDVVFVPYGFPNKNEFDSVALEHADFGAQYKGVLYFEPFRSNSQKFIFWKTAKLPDSIENNFTQKSCQYADSGNVSICVAEIKNWLSSIGCSYDKAMIIVNNSPGSSPGWAESLGGQVGSTAAREYSPFESQGHMETVHELAHILGLTDAKVISGEYGIYNYPISKTPNCDLAGCSKWCGDYIKTPSGWGYELCKDLSESSCRENVNCSWLSTPDLYYKTRCVPLDDHINIGVACLEGTGCFHNCNGVGGWRAADYSEPGHRPTSMMFYLVNALGFDTVDKRFLKSVLEIYQ